MFDLRLTIEVLPGVAAMQAAREALEEVGSFPVAEVKRLPVAAAGAWTGPSLVASVPCRNLPDLRRKASTAGSGLYLRGARVIRWRVLRPARGGAVHRAMECRTAAEGFPGGRRSLPELIGRARGAGSMVQASQAVFPGQTMISAAGRMDCEVVTRLRRGTVTELLIMARAALPTTLATGRPMEILLDSDPGADAGWDPDPTADPYPFLRRVSELFPSWEGPLELTAEEGRG